jgi:hypothetical protein
VGQNRNYRRFDGRLRCCFSQPEGRSPHLFEQPYRLHDAIKADGGRSKASPDMASEVFVGRCVDAKPGANQMTDGFGLKLTNVMR